MNKITLKQGEKKVFTFTYNVDITTATFTFGIKKEKSDSEYAIKIEDADFDKSEIDNKIVKCTVDTSSLTSGTRYIGEIKAVWEDTTDKSDDVIIEIVQPVIS